MTKIKNAESLGRNKGWANLMPPTKPGETRNPLGRPKGTRDGFRAHLSRLLRLDYETNEAIERAAAKVGIDYLHIDISGTNAKVLAQIRLYQALMGDAKAIEDIANRTDGKPTAPIELSGTVQMDTQIMTPAEVEAFEQELRQEGWKLPGDM